MLGSLIRESVLCCLQDVDIIEEGAKHTLILYNCKVPQTGEVAYSAANAKCSANLKVKGEITLNSCPLKHFQYLV